MKYEIQPTTKFKNDLKLCKSRGYDIEQKIGYAIPFLYEVGRG